MVYMFNQYSSLNSINLSLFDTNNVKDKENMFSGCNLKKENIIINNKNDELLKQIK